MLLVVPSDRNLTSAVHNCQRPTLFDHPVSFQMLRPFRLFTIDAKHQAQSGFVGGDGHLHHLALLFRLYDWHRLRTQSTMGRYYRSLPKYGKHFLPPHSPNKLTWYAVSPMATRCCLRHYYRNLLIHAVLLPRQKSANVTQTEGNCGGSLCPPAAVSNNSDHLAHFTCRIADSPNPRGSVIAAATLRLHFLNTQINSSNPTLHGVNAVVWTEIQLQYSITACVCYCLRTFVSVLSTNYGSTSINLEVYDTVNGRSTQDYSVGSQQRSLRSVGNNHALDATTRQKQNGWLESATGGEDRSRKNPYVSARRAIQ